MRWLPRLDAMLIHWLRMGTVLALVLICFAGGGGAREDVVSLLFLRPGAVICAALILLTPGRIDWRSVRVPLLLCLAFAAWMGIQLIPLPPDVWMSLPGRALFAEAMNVAGLPQPWRPLSVSPDRTLNSLAAMVVPIATLIGFAALDRNQRLFLLPVLIVAVLVSVLFGMAQLASGESSAFYLYRVTNRDSAVGLFANRNHQAALLAVTFPMLAVWAATRMRAGRATSVSTIITAAVAVFLVPMVMVTGSRAGLLFGGIAAAGACLLYVQQTGSPARGTHSWRGVALGFGAIALAGLAFSFAAFDRAESLRRLLQGGESEDVRLGTIGPVTELARNMMPFGSGFGTFDPMYRIHEPGHLLTPFYLNHAHNDLLELAITGGIPALLLLAIGLAWIGISGVKVCRTWYVSRTQVAYARLGLLIVVLLLGWSLVDYPLRTPSIAMLFAIASGWLGMGRGGDSGASAARGRGATAKA